MKLKAYTVHEIGEPYCILIFAENANKAKSALCNRELFEDVGYTDLSAKREPSVDKYVNIRSQQNTLDWENPNHRKILEKELGWCEIDY